MTALDRLANSLGRNDETPNQELARELAASGDSAAIAEIAAGLDNPDKAVQSDCIKVLYEVGCIKPELISRYTETFLRLLSSKNNRIVWGAMIALSTVARLNSKMHAESTLPAISRLYSDKFITVLKSREEDMTPAQSARIRKLYRACDKLK